jgi:hypothetical protein
MESSSQTAKRLPNRDCTLVIMAKAPRPGMVKTRLTQSLPVEVVTELYRCLLQDTIALACSLMTAEVAIVCPASDVEELRRFVGEAVQVVAQKGEGLAVGLTSVFAHFAVSYQRVVAFNSDSPHLPSSVLEDAFDLLAGHDVVVGPTHDGGYYLVGAKTAHPSLFENDGMGTRNALEALLARARVLHLSVDFAPPFYDIDVVSDLTRLSAELSLASARAPRTAEWLKKWGAAVEQLRTIAGNL